MKYKIIAVVILIVIVLATSLAFILQSEEKFGEYSYCSECDSNYTDKEGNWYYDHDNNNWCKVNENKCNTSDCKSVGGYPCCKNSSTDIIDIDQSGAWGAENNNNSWCLIKPLQPFTDVSINLRSWLDLMPKIVTPGEKVGPKEAYFVFTLGIKASDFFEKYEFEYIMFNGQKIDKEKIYLQESQPNIFRVNSVYYDELNRVKFVIKNKETNQSYFKELTAELSKSF